MADYGWLPSIVWETLGLRDYAALVREYERAGPPMRQVLALHAGWKPPKPKSDLYDAEDLFEYLKAFPGGTVK